MISDFFTVVKFERATEWRASPGRCCHYATEPEPKDWFGRSETVHDSSHYSANSTWDSSFLLGIVQPEDMLWFPKRSTVAAWDGRCAVDRRVSDWKQWWAARRVFQDFAGRSCRSLAVTSSPAPGASLELMLTSHVILKMSLYFGYISFCHISFCHISFGHICSKLCPQSYHNQSSLSSCPGLLVQMSDSQILVLQFSNLSCKTTLCFSPALISKVNNTWNGYFQKVSLGHCDFISSCLVVMWQRRAAGGPATWPASPRSAPGWSRCARWCWPGPGCPWARSGHCLLSPRHRLGEFWAGFCLSRWPSQPYNQNSEYIFRILHKCLFWPSSAFIWLN